MDYTRRDYLKPLTGTAVAANTFPVLAAKQQRKLNFIIIFTDDQGYQYLGCYGTERFKTPNIDRLAAEGMRFTDFYSASSVCSPSRAALLTGCYPPRVSISGVIFPGARHGLNPDEVTIADLLKTQGYATACVGKWHLGHRKEFLPTKQGFDEFFGLPYSNDMIPADQPGGQPDSKHPPLPLIDGEKAIEENPDQRLLTKRYTERSVDFIKRSKNKPFFLYLAHTMPHVPLFASEKFAGKSKSGRYGDAMEEIDWSTGEIIRTLKEQGIEKDTIVIFTSDNGPWIRAGKYGKYVTEDEEGCALPLKGGKWMTYEGGMRMPCIAWSPGNVPAGTECSEVCATIDLLPTLGTMAGAALPSDRIIDGKDISQILTRKAGAKSPHEYFYYCRYGRARAVRNGKWKLRETMAGKPRKLVSELYNLQEDISETTNLADENPDIVKKLHQALEKFNTDLKANTRPAGKV